MAGAKSRSEMERLEHRLGNHQVRHMAMVGRGPQPQDWYNGAKKQIETREKPTSFNAQRSLRLGKHTQELNNTSVTLGNKLKMVWPPSETASLAVDGKVGVCSWKKPALSLQTNQAVGSRAGRMVSRGQKGKSVAEAVVEKGSFLPGVTYTKGKKQTCPWPNSRQQRDGEKIGDGDMPKGKRGGMVSQRVAAIQDKALLRRGPVSASPPLVLEPVASLSRGLHVVHHARRQSTKPTNWMYLGGTGGCMVSAAELPVKGNEVCGSLSTPSEGHTMPVMTDDKPELTIAATATAEDKHHPGERMNSPQHTCVPGEPGGRNTTSIELKCGAEGVVPPENEAEEAHCLSDVSRTPSVSSDSLEPESLSVSPEIAEQVTEKSKANTNRFPEKQVPGTLGENTQPSSISHLPEIESKGAEFEKAKEVKPTSTSEFLEDPIPEHISQGNKAEKSRVSSPGLPDKTDDHSVSSLQETERQGTCGPLITNPQEDIFRHSIKSPGKDFPVSADTPLEGICATQPPHDQVNNSKSKDPREVLSGNILHISEQITKTLDSSKLNISLDKSRGHPASEEKMDSKPPGESTVPTSMPGAQSKETRSSEACRETSGKGFRLGKNPFTTLFGSESKGSTPKKETKTQRKPTKPQSALVTLFGYSSEKKQSPQEKPARSSEQTNVDDRPEKPQDLLSSSSQAKQKSSKNDQLPQPGKVDIFIQESSGGFSDSTEGKETNVLFLAPGTNISCDDKHERTQLNIHDQLAFNSQFWQQWDSSWPSLVPAQENQKEAAVTSEGGTNPLHPPPEFIPAAEKGKNLIGEGNYHDAHPLEVQKLLSLDAHVTGVEDVIFFSPGNSEKLPKEGDVQLDNVDFLDDNNSFFFGGENFPGMASKTPVSDLQNSEAETPPSFVPSSSELCQEIPAETNAPLVLWDTSSFSLLAGQDAMNIGDLEGIRSCELVQQLDPQCQPPKAAGDDTFGLGFKTEGSKNEHSYTQEDNFPPRYIFTSHTSEILNQGVFDPFNVDLAKMGPEAPEKMNTSRETSGVGEDYGSLSSANSNVLNDGLVDQEFFI